MFFKYRNLTRIISIAFLLVIAGYTYFLFSPIVTDKNGFKYTVRSGTSMRSVIDDLTNQNIINHPWLFRSLVFIKNNSHELKSGEYFFPKGTTPLKLLKQITTGTGILYHSFTIIPGWNFNDLRKALFLEPSLDHTSKDLDETIIMSKIGEPGQKPEGKFFPDTYYFSSGSSDITLLKRAHRAMQEKLKTAWEHRDPGLPYKSSYDALIVASLIEKEAEAKHDRPLIAGVIINRLKKDMLLQIDPTVIYGLGIRYDGIIHRTDLLEDTPYNTYVHKGLPPTPISMPGFESIDAAMHPQKHDYYYYVAKAGETSHQFSKTLEDHNKAVAESKKPQPWFFNSDRIRYYLLQVVSQQLS